MNRAEHEPADPIGHQEPKTDHSPQAAPARPVRLGDAMVLVAATAVGLLGALNLWKSAVADQFIPPSVPVFATATETPAPTDPAPAPTDPNSDAEPPPLIVTSEPRYVPGGPGGPVRKAAFGVLLLSPMLAAWTLAVAGLRLRPPRPSLQQTARRYGGAAVVAASLAMLAVLGTATLTVLSTAALYGNEFATAIQGYGEAWNSPLIRVLADASFPAALAVLVSWAGLLLTRMGQFEHAWIDRLGRLLGLLWILTAIAAFSVRPDDGSGFRGYLDVGQLQGNGSGGRGR